MEIKGRKMNHKRLSEWLADKIDSKYIEEVLSGR